MSKLPIRQGDVLLIPAPKTFKLPTDAQPVPLDKGRIVLAYGEVTGHAHAIADHAGRAPFADTDPDPNLTPAQQARVNEIAEAAIARAKARLYRTPAGERYLVVDEPVTLTHEEHTAHTIPAGIYQVPTQVEYTPAELRRVAD